MLCWKTLDPDGSDTETRFENSDQAALSAPRLIAVLPAALDNNDTG